MVKPIEGLRRTADPSEIARFDRLAEEWWNPKGKFKVVHAFNAARVTYIAGALAEQFGRSAQGERPLDSLRVLDVGCGAGLVSEPIARLGAKVTAIDASAHNIEIARRHALSAGTDIDYRCNTPEEISSSGDRYDAVLSLEVVEHVADLPVFLDATASMVRPGGLLIIGTLNRTFLSWLLAIVAAEYVLGWLPRGTHDWRRFVSPTELSGHLAPLGFDAVAQQGVTFNPLLWRWGLGKSSAVNYLRVFRLNRGTGKA